MDHQRDGRPRGDRGRGGLKAKVVARPATTRTVKTVETPAAVTAMVWVPAVRRVSGMVLTPASVVLHFARTGFLVIDS